MDKVTPERASVYVVIVTHNGALTIEKCLRSVQQSTYPTSAIVVDNASTDNTPQLVQGFDGMSLIGLPTNVGFGLANNRGMRVALDAGADYVFLLNQDAWIQPKTLEELVRCAESDGSYGILSPLHLDGEGAGFDRRFIRYSALGAPAFYSDLYQGTVARVYPLRFVNAAAWLVRRECVTVVGGFDPVFHMYEEDRDYCKRALYHGFQLGLVPSAVVMHARLGAGLPATKSRPGKLAALQRKSDRARNRAIVRLKDAKHSFLQQWALVTINAARDSLAALISLNLGGMASYLLGYLKALAAMPRVLRHRRTCLRKGPHWL